MEIHIPEDCKKIHVLFSGGVDSTLLLYLLLLEKQQRPDLEIKCYGLMMAKSTIKYTRCREILDVLEQRFKIKIPFQNFDRKFILREFAEMILSVEPGYVFSGCNKVLDFLNPTNYIPGDTPPVRGKAFNEFHIRPFIDMDKGEIISCYVQHNILDILEITYSCGYSMKKTCGKCYFCLERSWGLKVCGINS
jgi:7-cyano-7-deazaguanine synthase in queuosine biosynthesis